MSAAARSDDAEGPWRTSPRLLIVVTGRGDDGRAAEMAAAHGAAIAASGFEILDACVMAPAAAAGLLRSGATADCDLLLLDVATVLTPASVEALRQAADSDPMLLAVSPRFAAPDEAGDGVRRPSVDYAVLPDTRCVYVKGSTLATFGATQPQDRASDAGSAGIAEVLLHFNRFGFRTAVVNDALARHPEGFDPARSLGIPPAWRPALAHHLSSAPRVAETLLAGFRPDADGRRAIAFDLAHVGPDHSGTTRLAHALIGRAATTWSDCAIHVVANPQAFAFHFSDVDGPLLRVDPEDRRSFAAVIRFGQPFLWQELDSASRRAPVLVLFMLDTIGLDCLQHAPEELDALWRFIFAEADGVLFNSAFTQRQFARRFTFRPGLPHRASLHSLALADYREPRPQDPTGLGDTILVVGNGFPHKRVGETAALLAAAGLAHPVVVLGLEAGAVAGVMAQPSGDLAPDHLAALYAAARVVVYPSVYEGFGFPILEALAHRRPVLVRPLPPYAEIAAGLPEAANIHVFHDDDELLQILRAPPAWIENGWPTPAPRTWDDAADDLRAVLDEAMATVDFERIVRRIDFLRGRMAYMRGRAFAEKHGDAVAQERVERVAGLAGRVVQAAVLALGNRVPGSRAVLALAGHLQRWRAATGGRG